jgi:uncharacterized protein YbjT (DUF2867 family)
MRVLLLGAGAFIGRHILAELAERYRSALACTLVPAAHAHSLAATRALHFFDHWPQGERADGCV